MTPERPDEGDPDADRRGDRREPVGEPVVRGDPSVTGSYAEEAERFDPSDDESLRTATEVVREFATSTGASVDNLYMLRGAAACAALVRGEGSYKAAAERAGEAVTVSFLRKWSRVHDLPIEVRRHIAAGEIAPTAAKHIGRVTGDARYLLAWATLDDALTVRDLRAIASDVNGGTPAERALQDHGVDVGRLEVTLPTDVYLEFRRRTSHQDRSVDSVVADALDAWLRERS